MFGFQKRLERLKSAADGCLNQLCDTDSVTPSTPEPASSSKSRRTLEQKTNLRDVTYPLVLRPISKSSTTPPEVREFVAGCLRSSYEFVPNDGRFVEEIHFFNHQSGCFVIAMFASKLMAELFVGIGSLVVSTCPFVPEGCRLALQTDPNRRTFEKIRLRDDKQIYLHGVPTAWADAERLKSYFETVVLQGIESDFGRELVKQVQLLPGAAFVGFRRKAVVDILFYRCGKDKRLLSAISEDSKLVRFLGRSKRAQVEAAQAKPPVKTTSVSGHQATPAAAQGDKSAAKAGNGRSSSLASSLQATRMSSGAKRPVEALTASVKEPGPADVQVTSEEMQSATTKGITGPGALVAVAAGPARTTTNDKPGDGGMEADGSAVDAVRSSLGVERSEAEQKGRGDVDRGVTVKTSSKTTTSVCGVTVHSAVGQENGVDSEVDRHAKIPSETATSQSERSDVGVDATAGKALQTEPHVAQEQCSERSRSEERNSKKCRWDQHAPKSTSTVQCSVSLAGFDVHSFVPETIKDWIRKILLEKRPGRDVSLRVLWQKQPEAQLLLDSEDTADALMDAYVDDTERFCMEGLQMQLSRHKFYVRPGAVYKQSRTSAVVRDVMLLGLAGARLYPEQLKGAVSELLERTLLAEGVLERCQPLVKGIMFVPGSHFASIALEEPVARKVISIAPTIKLAGRTLNLAFVQSHGQVTLKFPFMPTSLAEYDPEGFKSFIRNMLKRVRPSESVADSIREIKWVACNWIAEVILRSEDEADALMEAFLEYTPEFHLGGSPFSVYRSKSYVRPGVCYRNNVSPSAGEQQLLVLGIERSLDPRQVKAGLNELLSRALAGAGVLELQGSLLKNVYFRPGDTLAYVKVDAIVGGKLLEQWFPLRLAGNVLSILPYPTLSAAAAVQPPSYLPRNGNGGWIDPPAPTGGWIEAEAEEGEVSDLDHCIHATLTSLS